jgi:DNA-binding NtrC family response regulator
MFSDIYSNGDSVAVVEQQAQAALACRAAPRRILIADDERHIGLAIRECLEAADYEVEEAHDGREAIHAVIHASPDLLLLDLAMPNLDGLSALRDLATTYHDIMPRVVIVTAWGSISSAEEAEKFGAAAFLEKPLLPDVLRATVARVLRERKPIITSQSQSDQASKPFFGPSDFYLG